MHIPDGSLSPQTYAPAYGLMIPIWTLASARLKKTLRTRQVPVLALGSAFSFVIMMFNIPVPGGTSGHAVGSVLIAILLGPWAAVIAVSLALTVQALMFGDGGVTTLGANCLNMAVLMPLVGWSVYRLVAGRAPAGSARHWVGGAIGGYIGLNAAALSAGIMFGIQPLIAHDAAGYALYAPFGLKIAVPAMAAGHLLVFGFVEAAVTGLVVAYLQRTDSSLFFSETAGSARRSILTKTAAVLCALVALCPLGLILPAKLATGTAWGEWSAQELGRMAGYVPQGIKRMGSIWHAPLPDYSRPGAETASWATQSFWYILSAVMGVCVIVAAAYGLSRLIAREGAPSRRSIASGRTSLARKAAGGFARLITEIVENDIIASRRGLLQGIDARAKVLGLLCLIVTATLVRGIAALAVLYCICATLAVLSGVPARRFAGTWLAAPLVCAAAVLPAALNIVTPGAHLLTICRTSGHFGWWQFPGVIGVTDAGLLVVARFVLRTAVCVSFALLLTTTTPSAKLFRGLRALGVPAIFVALLAMMERYVGALMRAGEEIHLAKMSRCIRSGGARQEQAWVAAGMGSVFRRAQSLGQAVHLAMLSRGYTGEIYLMNEPGIRKRDFGFPAAAAVVAAVLLIWMRS